SATARAHYCKALRLHQDGEHPRGTIGTLEQMAITIFEAQSTPTKQEAEWAARLIGAAETQRKVHHFPPSGRRLLHNDPLAHIRATLGEEAFATAWAEGSAMTLEEAVEFALQEKAGRNA